MKAKSITAIGALAGIAATVSFGNQQPVMAGVAFSLACINTIWLAVLVFDSAWYGNSH